MTEHEEEILDQHALDLAIALRIQKIAVVPKHVVHNILPTRAVEKSGLSTAQNESIPACRIRGVMG